MALRIAFDLDGVLADMDGELLRQARSLFGEQAIRRLQELQPDTASQRTSLADTAKESAGAGAPDEPQKTGQPNVESIADEPPLSKTFRLTPRQHSRLWRHVQTIDN